MSAGAVAAISALFSARLSAAMVPGTLSTVTRVTAWSISPKTYQATALAMAVKPAREQNARKSLALMPYRVLRCLSPAAAIGFRRGSAHKGAAGSILILAAPPLGLERQHRPGGRFISC